MIFSNRVCYITVVITFIIITTVTSEYFTAITDMKKLLQIEGKLIEQISAHIEFDESRLNHLINRYNNFTNENKNISIKLFAQKYKNNKRMLRDWKHVSQIVRNKDSNINLKRIKNLQQSLPSDDDLEGAAVALSRLTDTYKLNTSDLAVGKIRKVQYNTGLSADDLLQVGILTLPNTESISSKWFIEAQKRFEINGTLTDDSTKMDILNYLAEAHQKEGNYFASIDVLDEILEVDPHNEIAAENKTYLEQKLIQIEENPYDTKEAKDKLHEKHVHKYDKPYEIIPDWFEIDGYQRKLYEALCRGDVDVSPKLLAPLRCRYVTNKSAFLKIAPFKLEEVSLDPYIVLYHEVIYDAEIEMIKNHSRPQLERASVESYDGEDAVHTYIKERISKATWIADHHNKHMTDITKRLTDMTGLSMEFAELLQIVNYGMAGYYDMHFDFALEDDLVYEEQGIGNRVATVLFYMSDVAEGGATAFPMIKRAVFPKKGTAVFWYNLYASGVGDLRTKHAGCPVLVGNKWVSNKWIHLYDQRSVRPCKLYPDHPSIDVMKKVSNKKKSRNN